MTRIERPPQDVLERMYLIEKLSAGKIGQQFGCHKTTVTKWLREYGIPVRTHARPTPRQDSFLDKELLERVYVRQNHSMSSAARVLGTSLRRVSRSLDHHGIPRKSRKGSGDQITFLDPDVVRKLYVNQHRSVENISQLLRVSHQRVRAVLDQQGITKPEIQGNPARRTDHVEHVVIGLSATGKEITKPVAILECGHKHPIYHPSGKVTVHPRPVYGCRACAQKEKS